MLNGIYQNPTTIFFGKSAENHAVESIKVNYNKILLLYGGDSFENSGLGHNIRRLLSDHDIDFIELSGVKADPDASLIYKGIDVCRKNNVDFILAVGGGSVIDSAKAMGIGIDYEGDFFDFFEKNITPLKMMPIGVILTISGAGSESSNASVITKNEKKYSCGSACMFPTMAVLNPENTLTVPLHLTACGIVDSISHILERYFSETEYIETSSRLCEGLLISLMETGTRLINDLKNKELRAEAMWAAKLAHDNTLGFGRKQDWATHTIAHEVGVRTQKPHGEVLAVLFPAWMKFVSKLKPTLFIQLATHVFNINTLNLSDSETVEQAIQSYESFLSKMGMPSRLEQLGLNNSEFEDIALQCSKTTQSGTIGNFIRLSQKNIIDILEFCA